MKVIRSLTPLGLVLAALVALAACRTSKKEEIYNFDAAAHQRAVELKSEAMGLLAVSGEPFARHRAEVEAVSGKVEQAYELSAAAAENELVVAEWAAMKDATGDLYGGYVRRWQASGTVDQATRDTWINRVTARFDYILCLEAAKRTKSGHCAPPGAAQPEATQPEEAEPASPPA
jgi:hypothetical protein